VSRPQKWTEEQLALALTRRVQASEPQPGEPQAIVITQPMLSRISRPSTLELTMEIEVDTGQRFGLVLIEIT
jgi:hypothetical protein